MVIEKMRQEVRIEEKLEADRLKMRYHRNFRYNEDVHKAMEWLVKNRALKYPDHSLLFRAAILRIFNQEKKEDQDAK